MLYNKNIKLRNILIIDSSYLLLILLLFIAISSLSYSQNSWTAKANFGGTGRGGAACFTIGSKAYAGLGYDGAYKQDLWEYDPATDVWTQKANFGGGLRHVPSGFSIGTKGYIAVGFDGTNHKQDLWEYDPAANNWTQKANFPGNPRRLSTAFSIGEFGYVGLGYDNVIHYQDFYRYNQNTNTWSQIANFGGTARRSAVAFVIDSRAYIGTGFTTTYVQDLWEYNPVTNVWTQKANFGGTARERTASFAIKNKGYIALGNNGSYLQDLWEYDPSLNNWISKANYIGSARFAADISFSINNYAYIGTGFDGSYKQDIYQYTPGTTPSSTTNLVSAISNTTATSGGNVIFDGNYSVTARGVVWSTSSNPTVALTTKTVDGSGTGLFASSITGLTAGTLYYYRAYATNSQGTSYGPEYTFTTLSNEAFSENEGPNGGDANNDGVLDSQQDHVVTLLNRFTGKYITIVDLNNYAINSAVILSAENDNLFYYPGSLTKFTINASNTRIKIYYHNISNLRGFLYKKLNSSNQFFNFRNYEISTDSINGQSVATVTLTLSDGGPEDYDGIVNGVITDPGGPAILASNANIPTLSEWARIILISLLVILGIWKIRKYV